MAIPIIWYARDGGSDLNSGGTNADAPTINGDAGTPFVIVGGTGGTYAPGGLTGLGGEALNLQIAGVSTIRGITVLTDTTFTLDAAVANAAYNGRIGGARDHPAKLCNTGAGLNAKIAAGHAILIKQATYAGQLVIINVACHLKGQGDLEWTIDGAGLGAGSDPVSMNTGAASMGSVSNCVVINAVDVAFLRSGNAGTFKNCRAVSPGGAGFNCDFTLIHCSSRGATGVGIQPGSSPVIQCEISEAGGISLNLPNTAKGLLLGNTIYDGASIGISLAAGASVTFIVGNTIEGCTGDGIEIPGVATISGGSCFQNNTITNCGGYGIDSSAGAQTAAAAIQADFNNYYGNATGNRNWIAGAHDLAVDPGFVNAGGDDYTLDTGSALIAAGYSPLKSPMKLNIGATIAELAVPGASTLVGGALVQ